MSELAPFLGRIRSIYWFVSPDSSPERFYDKYRAPAGTIVRFVPEKNRAYLVEGEHKGWYGPGIPLFGIKPISPLEQLAREAK